MYLDLKIKLTNSWHDVPHEREVDISPEETFAWVNERVLGLVVFEADAGLFLRTGPHERRSCSQGAGGP